jgi:hypothetical protein
MIQKIDDIQKALNNQCYLSALALALTLPDICGMIAYPNLTYDNGKRNGGKQYSKWFDKWVNQYYADPKGWTDDYSQAINPYFTGKMCYQLRCKFLHEGHSNIDPWGKREDDHKIYSYSFELSVGGADSKGKAWSPDDLFKGKQKESHIVSIDIVKLCESICLAAQAFYEQNEKDKFKESAIRYINFKK